jgi:hypothetical protein
MLACVEGDLQAVLKVLYPDDTRHRPASLCRPRHFGTAAMADKLSDEERAGLRAELERLRQEHRDLDSAIEALIHIAASDQLQIQRLKKRKLVLRDKIDRIEDVLTPDIIA